MLIGGSGQRDAALYASVSKEFPGRVLGIHIRDADPGHDSVFDASVDAIISDENDSGVPMMRDRESDVFGHHTQSIGLLPSNEERNVAASAARDKSRDRIVEVSTIDLK